MMSARIKKILMDRDGLTEKEASERLNEVQSVVNGAIANETNIYRLSNDIDNIIEDELGLEPDFIEDFLY